jgi:uncharacterized repeat protein (TIGR01451 family)
MVRSNDMDCSERLNQLRAQNSATRRISLAVAGICCLVASAGTHAAGTTAGREVNNTATVSYEIAGEAQTPVTSNTAQLFGTESFRLVADDAVAGDSFDPNLTDIYIETNTTPGLQIGAGGDTPYTTAGDPLLVAEATVVVYLTSGIDSGLGAGLEGAVALRAVPATLIAQIGSDQPVDFPPVGTSYPGAGDPAEVGGGNVTAVVGTSFTQGNLLLLAEGRYVVSAAVVALSKNAVAVLDPFGGATLVPGSVITYEIVAEVLGSGPAEAVAVTDSLPTELLYVPASLTVSFLPVGENADDDFAPSGVDNTGFDPNSQAVTVNLADLAGGTSITITYQASIR